MNDRVGFAIVGLGKLALGQILPAFAHTQHCRVAALVSGNRDKALKTARENRLDGAMVFDYANFDRIADHADVEVVYVVLPNALHAEYTIRAARAGKHVLCEKPMAITVFECRQMIEACQRADRRLMVAYRCQYDPADRALRRLVKEGKLGRLKTFLSSHAFQIENTPQWRLQRALSGGGALPDIGIYCINGVRYLSGEEPYEIAAIQQSPPGDPRFREVEETVHFTLGFPSGLRALCHTSYGTHRCNFLRLVGTEGWAELDPAYSYGGLKLRLSAAARGETAVEEPPLPPADQFALEMDHMAQCVREGRRPYSPGEEGLQDQRLMEAIYVSAREGGRPMKIDVSDGSTWRGPEPPEAPQRVM
ncbi:MAG TPA: Gfo/Idh/MocA family oxidoreductase [Burkholderiaceae bacterium]|jgi:predicted dehydrogenase|nr:Gfo/Idh/MocA family oxidoreductase [Burkholderiaceae bacterium]